MQADEVTADEVKRPASKAEAQRRAEQIRSFNSELALLEQHGVVRLNDEARARIGAYHGRVLEELTGEFDIDVSSAARQMSLGMRAVSFLGALALSAAVFFFFYRFWGLLSTWGQVAILIAAPLILAAGAEFAARREKTLYFTSLISLVAFTAFVLDLSMLGQIFCITPSQNAFLVWGAFALLLAYAYRLKLLLVAGISCLMGYLAATMGTWCGLYWLSFGERPENFIVAGLLVFAAAFIPHKSQSEFANIYRVYGLLAALLAILILSHWGGGSYLPWQTRHIEYVYQIAGFALSGAAIWLGIRRAWPGVTNLGSTFFVIFLYTKLFDWWWKWMPKYLFFLLLGCIAVLILLVLKRARGRIKEVLS